MSQTKEDRIRKQYKALWRQATSEWSKSYIIFLLARQWKMSCGDIRFALELEREQRTGRRK